MKFSNPPSLFSSSLAFYKITAEKLFQTPQELTKKIQNTYRTQNATKISNNTCKAITTFICAATSSLKTDLHA
jgi:hypothetical protein